MPQSYIWSNSYNSYKPLQEKNSIVRQSVSIFLQLLQKKQCIYYIYIILFFLLLLYYFSIFYRLNIKKVVRSVRI